MGHVSNGSSTDLAWLCDLRSSTGAETRTASIYEYAMLSACKL